MAADLMREIAVWWRRWVRGCRILDEGGLLTLRTRVSQAAHLEKGQDIVHQCLCSPQGNGDNVPMRTDACMRANLA